jgi:hypothetical protein
MVVVGQGRVGQRESARDALLVGGAEEAAEFGDLIEPGRRYRGFGQHDLDVEHPKPRRTGVGYNQIGPLAQKQIAEDVGSAGGKRGADLPEIENDEGLRLRARRDERSHPRLPSRVHAVHMGS